MRPELRSLIPVVLCVLFPVSSAMSASGLPGDFNDDGLVNAADFTIWRDNFDSTVTLPNDGTPGTVDSIDYALWRENYGSATGDPDPPLTAGPGDPFITFTPVGAGAGFLEFVVDVHKGPDLGSLAIELAILAPVAQMDFMGFPIDTNVDAGSLAGVSGFDANADTWYNIENWPFANPGANPFLMLETTGYFELGSGGPLFISVGSDPTSATMIELLHLVILDPPPSTGGAAPAQVGPQVGAWSALLAGDGVLYSSGGSINAPVPLPAPLLLIAVPVVMMMRRRTQRNGDIPH